MAQLTPKSSSDQFLDIKEYYGGISDSRKIGPKGSFQFAQSINYRDEGTEFHLQPIGTKVSGTTVTGRIKWICDGSPYNTNKYFYDENGVIYQETSGGTWSVLRSVSNSKGQGFEIYSNYLYYSQNTQVGRYGPLDSSPSFQDDWAVGLSDTSVIGWAPLKAFVGGMAIGHGNYLAWYDGTIVPGDSSGVADALAKFISQSGNTPQTDALVTLQFDPGANVRCMEVIDEYLAIGTQHGTDITKNETGYVFYWDGSSDSFNFFASTENGGCNAVGNSNNRLVSILGSSSKLFINYRPFQPIQRIPKLLTKHYCEMWPGAITTWQNLVYFGLCANTDSTDIMQGAYSWGTTSSMYRESLSYDFPISTGHTGTTVGVSALKGMGNYLYMAWKDGSSYGVDKITANGTIASTGTYETLVFGQLSKDNQALVIKCTHYPLATGESVQIGYRLDRFSDYTFPESANSEVGSVYTRLPIAPEDARYSEIEFMIKLSQSNNTSPTIIYCGMKFEPLQNEQNDW